MFYKTLYTSQGNTIPPDNEFFQFENDTLLDCNESKSCEFGGLRSEKEFLEVLKDMDPAKSPGTDGLPAEFYKTFWDELAYFSLIIALQYLMIRELFRYQRDEKSLNLYQKAR